jgi:hypothetical protein
LTDYPNAAALSRRSLLTAICAGMAASAAPAAVPGAVRAAGPRALADLQRGGLTDWQAHLGQRFSLGSGGSLRLVAVEPLCSGGPTPARGQCFAALFEAAAGAAPEGDATYWLVSQNSAPMPLHLGAAAQVGGRTRLVAVFN